jgi:predicted ferric reductase
MGLVFRGIVWFGLYFALVLAPLFVASVVDPIDNAAVAGRTFVLEAGVAVGFIAFALIVVEFALVARLRAASEPFGTDALMQFHRQMGIAALGFVAAHPLLAAPGEALGMLNPLHGSPMARAGALAFWLLLLLVGSSVLRRRLRLRYEAWQWLHRAGAVVVVAAAAAHLLLAQGYTRAPAVAAAIWLYVVVFVALLLGYRVVRPLWLWRRPWTLVESRDISGDTRLLTLRPDGHAGLAFLPGQFAWLVTGRSPLTGASHPLSFASSAEPQAAGTIEFGVKALGDWSGGVVPALRPPARVWVDGAYGVFTPDRVAAQAFVLIAGGIGVSPLRSMILTLRERGDRRPVTLFFAARSPGRAMFLEELRGLAAAGAITLVPVFEAPGPAWNGERGFIDAALLRRHLPPNLARHHFFVCGPPPMMDAMERCLVEIGVHPANVHTERFDMV